MAGLTVSVVEVPQAMAYALIAGVPPEYGLYTSIIQGVIGALLSSSEHMTTGPTNTQSLLIASAVHRVMGGQEVAPDPERYLQLVFCLTLLKGLVQLAFAAADMGNMVRYVSRSVISGLVSGAGFLIFFGQLPALLGVVSKSEVEAPGVFAPVIRLVEHLDETNWRAIAVAVAVVGVILIGKKISRFFPGALVGVACSGLVVWAMGWQAREIPLIGALPRGLPDFQLPLAPWRDMQGLMGGAVALAVIGMLESVAIAKSIAARTGETVIPNQEFFAQGFKNAVTSFFQCIPGSGSFTRSALDYAAGAETRFAAVFNALMVGVIFLCFGRLTAYVPNAALAGVLMVIAFGLVEWTYLPRALKVGRGDALVWVMTFLSTLLVPLEYAIFIGVFLNIGLYLRTATKLHVREMIREDGQSGEQRFSERELTDRTGERPVVLLQVEGDLFFGIADELGSRLTQLTESSQTQVIILRMRRTHSVDATVIDVLERAAKDLRERGKYLLLCGVGTDLMGLLRRSGIVDLLGEANVIPTQPGLFGSVELALKRSEELLGRSVDTSGVRPAPPDPEEQGWAYAI